MKNRLLIHMWCGKDYCYAYESQTKDLGYFYLTLGQENILDMIKSYVKENFREPKSGEGYYMRVSSRFWYNENKIGKRFRVYLSIGVMGYDGV